MKRKSAEYMWGMLTKHPRLSVRAAYWALRHPRIIRLPGFISPPVAALLYDTVIEARNHPSAVVVEAGAYKGKSTVCLSIAARKAGKRIKTFELFSGLPSVGAVDRGLKVGQFSSNETTFRTNLAKFGSPEVVDLTIGNAIQTMDVKDFCVAFIDVDTYTDTK
jgi:hypothetical protein